MSSAPLSLVLSSPDEMAAFAQNVGALLLTGDTLLLQGDIGAGKSFFARALIQSLQDTPEDVPSPTFTLVQTYETQRGEVWHADLYRLGDPNEAEELGLSDAFSAAICLIEWPDRLGSLTPSSALTLEFDVLETEEHRRVSIQGSNISLTHRISKAFA